MAGRRTAGRNSPLYTAVNMAARRARGLELALQCLRPDARSRCVMSHSPTTEQFSSGRVELGNRPGIDADGGNASPRAWSETPGQIRGADAAAVLARSSVEQAGGRYRDMVDSVFAAISITVVIAVAMFFIHAWMGTSVSLLSVSPRVGPVVGSALRSARPEVGGEHCDGTLLVGEVGSDHEVVRALTTREANKVSGAANSPRPCRPAKQPLGASDS
jgi:hypothetical protein